MLEITTNQQPARSNRGRLHKQDAIALLFTPLQRLARVRVPHLHRAAVRVDGLDPLAEDGDRDRRDDAADGDDQPQPFRLRTPPSAVL